MLADLLEVLERTLETLGDGGHTTETSTLQLFALEERLCVLDKADIIAGNGLNEMLRGGELTKGDAEMVGIVERIHQGAVERMNVHQAGECVENRGDLLIEGLFGVLDLTSVEV